MPCLHPSLFSITSTFCNFLFSSFFFPFLTYLPLLPLLSTYPVPHPLFNTASTNTPYIPQIPALPQRAAVSLLLDEGWWHCMSGGIDNIYGAEWEWSIFLSGAVTPLAKLHHGQLPQQTPSSLLLWGLAPSTWIHGHIRHYYNKTEYSQERKLEAGIVCIIGWQKVQVWCVCVCGGGEGITREKRV